MDNDLIYLDHAATTLMDPEVHHEMSQYCCDLFGNPATLYSLGRMSNKRVEEGRAEVAAIIGCAVEEVYFTSGGTESDNWALQGVAFARAKKGKHIIISSIEHHAVLDAAKFLETIGYEVTYLPVDEFGVVSVDALKNSIRDDTILISVMYANNEIGTIQPIAEIGGIAHEAGVTFHTDAVQAVGKIPTKVDDLGVDLLAMSAHKFYGPKGVGAMYIRRGTRIQRFMHGGSQEHNKRAGTLNVPGIVDLGAATSSAMKHMEGDAERLRMLAKKLDDGLHERIPNIRSNGHPEMRIPGLVHICVQGVEGEAMLLCLDAENICVSSGSACTTGSLDPSHVLLAIGMPAEVAHSSLRFSLGRQSTEEEVDRVLQVFPPIVERLRKMSPVYKTH